MKIKEFRAVRDDVSIERPEDLVDREVSVHWHFQAKRYSVSLRASNGRWYAVRDQRTGAQLFFGKLILANARFKVQPAGARKAYKTGKRNVHASVIGTVRHAQFKPENVSVPCGIPVMYSPFLYPEPEFKFLNWELPTTGWDADITQMPGILEAEMLAVGITEAGKHTVPKMVSAGHPRLTRFA